MFALGANFKEYLLFLGGGGGVLTTSVFALGSNFKEQLGEGGSLHISATPPPPTTMSIFALGANFKEI